MLEVTTYSDARQNLSALMDKACDQNATVIVTRQNKKPVVVMSLEAYNSHIAAMDTTEYLNSTRANAQRLQESIDHHNSGDRTGYVTFTAEEWDAFTSKL